MAKKSAYQAWKEAKEKEKQRKEAGIVHFKEDSKSSRVQTTLPNYQGQSKDKSYKWETDLLKPLSIKRYGRSYNDKFEMFSKEQGLNANEYRKQLDFEEDRKKKGHYASGALYESEVMDGIFKNKESKEKQRFAANTQRSEEKANEKKKEQEKIKNPTENSFLSDIAKTTKGALYDALNIKNPAKANVDIAKEYVNEGKKLNDATKELSRGITRTSNTASLGVLKEAANRKNDPYYQNEVFNQREGGGKAADFTYDALGYLLPGVGAYKALNATKAGKAITQFGSRNIEHRLVSEAAKGAITGAATTGAEVGIRETLNPKDYNAKQNMNHFVMGTTIGTIADPLLYGAGKAIGKGIENSSANFMKGLLPNNEQVARNFANTLNADTALPIQSNRPNPSLIDELMPRGTDIANPNFVPSVVSNTRPQVTIPRVGTSLDEAVLNDFARELDPPVEKGTKIYRRGREDGNWWSESEEYVNSGFSRTRPLHERSFDVENSKILDLSYDMKPLEDLMTPEEVAILYSVGNQDAKRAIYENVLKRNGYDAFKYMDGDDYDNEFTTYFLADPNPKPVQQPPTVSPTSKSDPKLELVRANQEAAASKPLPDGVQAMQSEIIPLREPSGKQVKPITRQELLNSARKNLGVTIRHGRLGNVDDNVSGYFKVDPEVIRTRNYGDIGVISHEIGHHLDKQFKLTDAAFDSELMKLGRVTSGGDYTPDQVREEGLAEFIRLYLSDPQKALSQAPEFSQHFENVLPKKVKQGLMKTQADVDRWIEQGDYNRAAGKIEYDGGKLTVKEKITDSIDKAYTQFIDKYDIAKKIEIDVTGKVNEANNSLYKRLRLAAGAPKIAERHLTDLKNILKPIDQYGYNKKEVSRYIAMVHARDLEAQGIESGFTKGEIDAVINKLDLPDMQKVQKQLVMYSNNLLDILVNSGRLSQDAVNAMRKKHPNYVPFFRYFDEDMASGFGGKGFANLTNPVKRLKGSTKDVIDPLESLVKNTFAIINTAEKNKVGLELLKLSNMEGAGKYVEIVPGNKSKKENIVTVYQNGEPAQIQLDPDLHRVIQQMDEESSHLLIRMLSVPAQALRMGATLTPEFMLRNPIRDQFQAFVVSENGYFPPRDLPVGLFHAIMGKKGKSALYEQWARSGGGYGNTMSVDRNYLREQLKHLKQEGHPINRGFKNIINPKEWVRLLSSLSELTEEATKLGEFNRAIKKGKSLEESAFQSRDLMDFARSGNALKEANKLVAFLNANIQGKDKLLRSFKSNPSRFIIKSLAGVTLPTVGAYLSMQYLANDKQKETWQNAPQWMKESFMFLPIPGTDVVARIPKPFDLATLFANPAEHLLDHIYQNDPASLKEFATGTAIGLTKIPYMLTGIAPLVENWANKSFFTGGPVVPARDKDVLPEEQYGPSTSLTARTIGKITNYSPYKVDNLIRGYGAGLGKYATAGADNLLEVLNVGKMPPQEKKRWSEMPLLNAFTVDSTGGGKIVDDYYTTLEKLTQDYKTSKKRGEDYDREEDYKFLQYEVGKEMSSLNKQYREVLGSYDLSPEEKRRQLDAIDAERKELARRALSEIGE